MNDLEKFLAVLRKYQEPVQQMLVVPSASTLPFVQGNVTIELGVTFPMLLLEPRDVSVLADALETMTQTNEMAAGHVVDAGGNARAIYRPLLLYAWLMSYRLAFENVSRVDFARWDELLRTWCEGLADEVSQFHPLQTGIPSSIGAEASAMAWNALALHVAGKVFIRDPWTDLAAGVMGLLTRAQQPSGEFLTASPADHPESLWYHELCLLHAATSYAVQAEDRTVAGAVERASLYHPAHTQPDHATSQPWGLFAFIWNEPARPLADQMLHTLQMRPAEQRDAVSLILLADSLYCLRLFL